MNEDTLYTSICHTATLFSMKEGFFKDYVEAVAETAGKKWINNFGKIASDEKKIIECFTDKKIYDVVHGTLENVQELYRGKSSWLSTQRREEGIQCFQKHKSQRALLLLTQSVMKAPQTGSEKSLWCLALWARSQVLLQLCEFSHCLSDIQICLKEGLSENLKLEAYWRMAECYVGLKQKSRAKLTLSIILKLIEKVSAPNEISQKEWRLKVEEKLDALNENDSVNDCCVDEIKIPNLKNGSHPEFSCASNLLELSENETCGRFFTAKDSIQAGDTLIVEDAYTACLLPDKCGTHCYHCFLRLKVAVPCPSCSGVSFCSYDCLKEALNSYHQYECKYLDLMIGSGMSILCFISLRTVMQRPVEYFLKLKNKLHDSKAHEYCQIYNLVTHSNKRSPEDLLQRTLMCLFLLQILKKSGYFGASAAMCEEKLSDTEVFIGSLLLRHLQCLQFNAHEIYETVMKKDEKFCKIQNHFIGVGIYATSSYFNHDCYPAVCRYFCGNKIVIKALRPINCGEAVMENYGPVFTKKPVQERQRVLLSRYRFQCNCKACLENWPLFDDIDSSLYKIRCPQNNCRNIITVLDTDRNTDENDGSKEIVCTSCNFILKEEMSKELKKFIVGQEKMYEEGKKEMDSGNVEKAVSILSTYSNMISAVCYPPIKNLCLAHEGLRLCWAKDGSKFIVS